MSDASAFSKFVPGFEFMQSLVKNAGSALPGIGQWVAPTLDPAELEKRISELKTVQFWLEQNARMLSATIQALEVQKMTLSTLKTMNVQLGELRETLKIKTPAEASSPSPSPAPSPSPSPFLAQSAAAAEPESSSPKPGNAVDPMQWWSALTNQFSQLATSAMKDTAADAAKALAGNIVRQSFDAATAPMRAVATKAAKKKPAGRTTRSRPARGKASPSPR